MTITSGYIWKGKNKTTHSEDKVQFSCPKIWTHISLAIWDTWSFDHLSSANSSARLFFPVFGETFSFIVMSNKKKNTSHLLLPIQKQLLL